MLNLTIDGKQVSVENGQTVLDAAVKAGVDIPTLCHSKHLLPYGACRLCTVEVGREGRFRLQASCAYPAEEGLEVRTDTERVIRGRKIMVELLLARCFEHPAVRELAAELGVKESRFPGKKETCVLCGQCVRICTEVIGAGAIGFAGRGITRKVQTPFDIPAEECLACGACTFICPTGHIQMESDTREHWQNTVQPAARLCRYARIGFFAHKICPNDFRCQTCEVDQRMEELLDDHPAVVGRPAARLEPVRVGEFELLPLRHYTRGHVWAKFSDNTLLLGIDDFTRRVLPQIDRVSAGPAGSRIGAGETLWELSSGSRRVSMISPLAGKIVSVNPQLEVDPQLATREPYDRGWILLLQPNSGEELDACRRGLMTGKTARKWLAGEAERIQAEKLPEHLDDQQWQKVVKEFFS
jgi:glycine cleavage system H lipoate-binding protein/NAD-dependent dihydropyrimidine dehydrogenase PreA subunit